MKKLKNLFLQYPVAAALMVMLIGTWLTEIPIKGYLSQWMSLQKASYLEGILEQGAVSLLLIVLLAWLGLLSQAGFTNTKDWKQLWLNWPLLLYSLINIDYSVFDGTNPIDFSQPDLIILFGLLYLSVGFLEEILFRGVILVLMLRKWGKSSQGILWAVMLSSAVFGILHIINLIMGRRTLMGTIPQILYGIFFGVYFAACFLRNRSIWPVILTHALFDACGNFTDIAVHSDFGTVHDMTIENALITVALTLPLLIYGLILLKKVKPGQWQKIDRGEKKPSLSTG